jgi:hypothetical protein
MFAIAVLLDPSLSGGIVVPVAHEMTLEPEWSDSVV